MSFSDSIMFRLEEAYDQAVRISRNIVEDIRFGRKLYLNPVEVYSVQISKYLSDDANIVAFLEGVKGRYPYMHSHPVNVALLSFAIGKWLNLEQSKLESLVCAGLLHDIGKAKIKDSILNKADTLTLEEVEKLKAHPIMGYRILESVKTFDLEVLQAVLFHHERMDGTGYPLGLPGEKINLLSRIIAIADTFDAITAIKPYGQKNSPLEAAAEIQDNSLNHLDFRICRVFINKLIECYNGRTIRLSNEQVGNIVYINPVKITKPLVRCEDVVHDLTVEEDLDVVEFL